jgi:mono/diheme cytochrome c family protein
MRRYAALAAAVFILPAAAFGGEADAYGRKLYGQYCSACHGGDGKGDGIVSQFMTPKPTDLTQLAKQAGGRFPFYEVIRTIDGRETVRAHGDPDMPVWGEVFTRQEAGSADRHAIARGKVVLITDYLETIQAK